MDTNDLKTSPGIGSGNCAWARGGGRRILRTRGFPNLHFVSHRKQFSTRVPILLPMKQTAIYFNSSKILTIANVSNLQYSSRALRTLSISSESSISHNRIQESAAIPPSLMSIPSYFNSGTNAGRTYFNEYEPSISQR